MLCSTQTALQMLGGAALLLGVWALVSLQHPMTETVDRGLHPRQTPAGPHWLSSWLLQDVLCKVAGGSAMTVAEATTIADNALEHSVRTVLASLQAAEILKSTDGRPVQVSGTPRKTLRCLLAVQVHTPTIHIKV